MCMKKFDEEKIFFDKQYAEVSILSRTFCQVSLGQTGMIRSNFADPDQTALIVWSGSTLFAMLKQPCSKLRVITAIISGVLIYGIFQIEMLDTVKKVLIDNKPESFEDCVKFARLMWQENYSNTIQQLLYNFPPDQVSKSWKQLNYNHSVSQH